MSERSQNMPRVLQWLDKPADVAAKALGAFFGGALSTYVMVELVDLAVPGQSEAMELAQNYQPQIAAGVGVLMAAGAVRRHFRPTAE